MKYSSIVKYLKTFIPHGDRKWNKNIGLSRFKYLMDILGNPQNNLKFVHVGGTSGKGSTSTFLASILKESGYKTGLHLSPDVITIRERAQINGINISPKRFKEIYKQIQPNFQKVEEKYGVPPSYYEILLALAFVYFFEEKCDVVVLEVGLGGKLDGTNIIKSNYQIITNIGLDHTRILGGTKELILQDKQEIIKPNSIVVSGIQEPDLVNILNKKIEANKSKLFLLNRDFYIKHIQILPTKFDFDLDANRLTGITTQLSGLFQINNSSLAIAMALNMKLEFPKISNEVIRSGINKTKIPGRFQLFSDKPPGIIDGAHNPDKFEALVDSIKNYYPDKKFIIIFRYKKREDINQSLSILKSISQKIIITGSKKSSDLGWDKTYNPEDKNIINESDFIIELDLKKAYQRAQQLCKKSQDCGILVTGSLYMISEFLNILKQK
ncbi:MAG: folylpolyglutamate synthase/dihydrofolate synthase family protein [Candidatus Shapirobacteria bacterium]|nr:folylpolyglutamate synthase/dihydrofolate synthase family protein [Candidatus Shapirobacteria bacterium]